MHVMNLSAKERIIVVISACWLVLQCIRYLDVPGYYEEDLWFYGVLPVLITFGIMWTRRGRKTSDGPE